MRTLAIDIGNTRIKAGVFENNELGEALIVDHIGLEKLSNWIHVQEVSTIIYSSTASESVDVTALIPQGMKTLSIDPHIKVPIRTDYDRHTLGQDRLANAVAGHTLNPTASLVIDAGTCITYDWTVEGVYLGGSIAPGIHMRLEAMHRFTGRLPLFEEIRFTDLIGSTTEESMISGAFQGLILETQGVISEFQTRYPQGKVYLTGGDATLLAEPIENDIFADQLLTLVGLNAILEYNA